MNTKISEAASRLIEAEKNAIHSLFEVVQTSGFKKAVDLMLTCRGRVVVSGMGKSGIIGKKIAATLASTGTPSFFMHPAEALHGDLGMTRREDIFLILSKSGEGGEMSSLLASLKLMDFPIIAITGNNSSTLAKEADAAILYNVKDEGCPIGLAPMATTTASLVLGDALAAVLMELRGFQSSDFARFHPSGSLGRRLLTRVKDVMVSPVPVIASDKWIRDALEVMIATNLGAVFVMNGEKLAGIISDGDVKRLIKKYDNFLDTPVSEVMSANPITISSGEMVEVALRIMEERAKPVAVLPVIDDGKVCGLLRIHDILQRKISI